MTTFKLYCPSVKKFATSAFTSSILHDQRSIGDALAFLLILNFFNYLIIRLILLYLIDSRIGTKVAWGCSKVLLSIPHSQILYNRRLTVNL